MKTYVSARFPGMGKSHNSYKVACCCWKDIIITSSIPHNHSYSFTFIQQKTYGSISPEFEEQVTMCWHNYGTQTMVPNMSHHNKLHQFDE